MPEEVLGQLSTNYNLEDLNDKSVALQEGCPKELEGRDDSWAWLCGHFQESDYVKNAKTNKGNRNKKTLLHRSGSRPFPYWMEAQRQKSTSLATFMFDMAMSWRSPFIQLVLQEFASQLPSDTPLESVDPPQDAGFQILTETLDQTLGKRPGTYCRGMGNAGRQEPIGPLSSQSNQVTALTVEVAELKTQLASYSTQMAEMSQLLSSIVRSSFPAPNVGRSSSSDSIQPEHGHHTSAPIDHVRLCAGVPAQCTARRGDDEVRVEDGLNVAEVADPEELVAEEVVEEVAEEVATAEDTETLGAEEVPATEEPAADVPDGELPVVSSAPRRPSGIVFRSSSLPLSTAVMSMPPAPSPQESVVVTALAVVEASVTDTLSPPPVS
ncbi:unnamed protein product [Prunus armeniaca]